MGHPVRLLCTVVLALVALAGAPGTGHARASLAAEPDPLAGVQLRYWGSQLEGAGVLGHAPSGRLMVFANDRDLGRFLHFGFGRATASGGCKVTRWVVLDKEDNRNAWLYDAQWQPVDFTPLHLWGQYLQDDYWMHYLRLETAPDSFATDCAKVGGHAHRDPASRQVGPTLTGDLGPMTDVGRHPTNLLQVPSSFPYGGDSELDYSVEARPDAALWEELVAPPVPVDVVPELPPGSDLELSQPVQPQTLDLWTYDAPVTGTLVVRPTSLYTVHPRVRVTAAGLTLGADGVASYDEITRRVTVPVPDWHVSLAGQILWGRAPDKWHQPYHSVLTFVDDSWVYLSDQASDPVPACDTVDGNLREGCHRYYYDGDTGLQLDDSRLRPVTDPDGWQLFWREEPVRAGSSTGPVAEGTRLAYHGTGGSFGCNPLPRSVARGCAVTDVDLRLHQDGTYRFTKVSSLDGVTKQHHGTYRFTGTALVLDPAKFPRVRLTGVVGYWQGATLLDIDWSVAGVYRVQP